MAPGTLPWAHAHATAGVGTIPSVDTEAPSAHSPATRAASSIGPDSRGSRPRTYGPGPSTRAAARPRATTSSGVRSTLAAPRTPSVPNLSVMLRGSALGVLRGLAGLLEAVLLGLLLAGIASEEAGLLQRCAQLGIELDQRAGDAHAQRAGLTRRATAGNRRE